MGLFGFGGDKSAKIERLKKRSTNKWGQAAERQAGMRSLYDIGTPEAMEALLDRYTINTDVTIVDSDEKRQVYDWLIARGEVCIGPIERWVSTHDAVYWPLRALKEIAGIDRAVGSLLAALDRSETIETRVNELRAQLVSNLRDFPHPKILERLKALCADPLDEVRLHAIDGIVTYGPEEAVPVLAERILDPNETQRVKSVLFEQLVEHGWSLAPWQAQLNEMKDLPAHYKLAPGGQIVRSR